MPLFGRKEKHPPKKEIIEGGDVLDLLMDLERSIETEDDVIKEVEEMNDICEIQLRVIKVSTLNDVQKVAEELDRGNILILDMYDILAMPNDAKRSIEQLRAICRHKGADMRSLGNRYIIVAPHFVKMVS